ncbi:hypothetical protein ACDY96_27490 [Rhizobium mongolense]
MVDIDEIQHDQKGVVRRQEDWMVTLFICIAKMNDGERRLTKRPDQQ